MRRGGHVGGGVHPGRLLEEPDGAEHAGKHPGSGEEGGERSIDNLGL